MHFAVWATDASCALDARTRVRDMHRARLRASGNAALRVVAGGPTLNEHSGAMNGTLLVIDAPDIDTVRRFVASDPYTLAGVYAQVEVRPWQWGLGRPPSEPEGTP